MNIAFTVPGEPVAKGRARTVSKGSKTWSFTPQKTKQYEEVVKMYALRHRQSPLLTKALFAEILVYKSIPKTFSKKRTEMAISEELRPTTRPDSDNYAKLVLDALNGLIYEDDSQVVDLQVSKFYSKEPRVEVYINEL